MKHNLKEQTIGLYKLQANNLAKRIAQFLEACETDLNDFAVLPNNPELYLEFYKNNVKWVGYLKEHRPL